jgi:phytoene synthase
VDEPSASPATALEQWVVQSQRNAPVIDEPILCAWHDLCARYQLSESVIHDLLMGIRMDLTINRYATFADLWLYCYRVAGTVGLLSMQIIGHEPDAQPYAIKLGVALQLTNILRDIGEDSERGRIYLPQDELAAFGVSNQHILDGRNDNCWQQLMRFQIDRTRQLYEEAWPGIALLHRDGRYAVAVAATLYRAILTKIEANAYDNFRHRAFVPTGEKLRKLPAILWHTWRMGR